MPYRDPSSDHASDKPRPSAWELMLPVARLIFVPLSIVLGLPAALFFIASLFSAVLFFSMGEWWVGAKSLIAAIVCGGIVVMAYAPRNSLRR